MPTRSRWLRTIGFPMSAMTRDLGDSGDFLTPAAAATILRSGAIVLEVRFTVGG
jgi:hypothetical protein